MAPALGAGKTLVQIQSHRPIYERYYRARTKPMKNYSGYKWIKVKQFKFDASKSWKENYKKFEKHHIEETTFLINEIRYLSGCGPEATALRLHRNRRNPITGSSPVIRTISNPTCSQHPKYDGEKIPSNHCCSCWDIRDTHAIKNEWL